MKEDFVLSKPCHHIAFIMDGNGRWAKKRLLPRYLGHREGCKRLLEITRACYDLDIEVMTVYAFSTENWSRPQDEIDHLFQYLDDFFRDSIDEFCEKQVRINMMGELSRFPLHTQQTIQNAMDKTKDYNKMVLNICLNYGSRQEIVRAASLLAKEVKEGKLNEDDITPELFSKYLYSSKLPDVDLMIRTSGEERLSNFMLYQLAYAEFIFTPTYWPDFKKADLIECLKEYEDRDRRFGGLSKK